MPRPTPGPNPEPRRFDPEALAGSVRPLALLSRHAEPAGWLGHSQMGGLPYWPAMEPLPVDDVGRALECLIQFNLSEVPPLPGLPREGLLQLWVKDYYSGHVLPVLHPEPLEREPENLLDAENYRWLQRATLHQTTPSWPEETLVPLPGRLAFELAQAPPPRSDFHFEALFGTRSYPTEAEERRSFEHLIEPALRPHLGGYAHFPQGDPRRYEPTPSDWEVLLFLPSDEALGLMWGDNQELVFFCRHDAQGQLDLSRVWMCLNP